MTEELANKTGLLITRLTIPIGEGFPFQKHLRTHECLQILSGTGIVSTIGKDGLNEREVAPNDFINIPAGTWHRIFNNPEHERSLLIILSIKDSNTPDMVIREG